MIVLVTVVAAYAIGLVCGAVFGIWLDKTQRSKPIEIGVGASLICTTNDPTELLLVEPHKRHRRAAALGETRMVNMDARELGVILARIRIANPKGAWVLQRAISRAVEAAKEKLLETDFDQDGGAQ